MAKYPSRDQRGVETRIYENVYSAEILADINFMKSNLDSKGAWFLSLLEMWHQGTCQVSGTAAQFAKIWGVDISVAAMIISDLKHAKVCDVTENHGLVTLTNRRRHRVEKRRKDAASRKANQRRRQSHADVTGESQEQPPPSKNLLPENLKILPSPNGARATFSSGLNEDDLACLLDQLHETEQFEPLKLEQWILIASDARPGVNLRKFIKRACEVAVIEGDVRSPGAFLRAVLEKYEKDNRAEIDRAAAQLRDRKKELLDFVEFLVGNISDGSDAARTRISHQSDRLLKEQGPEFLTEAHLEAATILGTVADEA